jgi:hypothetical protein
MNAAGWERDGRLLADLRAALAAEPATDPAGHSTPAGYHELALAAFRIGRTGDPVCLAELTFDSACDPEPAGRTRTSHSARLLAFRADGYAIDVEIGGDGLLGQLHPDRPGPVPTGSVGVQSPHGLFGEATLDEVGGFALPLPPPGPVRLRARLTDLTVVTSWLLLRY